MVDDPDCLHNLIAAPEQQTALSDLRSQLEGWMVRTKDPMLAVFQKRDDAAHREANEQKVEREAIERRKNRPRKNKRNKVKK